VVLGCFILERFLRPADYPRLNAFKGSIKTVHSLQISSFHADVMRANRLGGGGGGAESRAASFSLPRST
jgi:hypothetical protein